MIDKPLRIHQWVPGIGNFQPSRKHFDHRPRSGHREILMNQSVCNEFPKSHFGKHFLFNSQGTFNQLVGGKLFINRIDQTLKSDGIPFGSYLLFLCVDSTFIFIKNNSQRFPFQCWEKIQIFRK